MCCAAPWYPGRASPGEEGGDGPELDPPRGGGEGVLCQPHLHF